MPSTGAPAYLGRFPSFISHSYQIFIAGGGSSIVDPRSSEANAPWRSVMPADKELRKYLIWRHAIDGYHWTPDNGLIGPLPADATAADYLPSRDDTGDEVKIEVTP
jgi:hypothetical protein